MSESANDNLGPHLLGRKKHEAETTDWKLADFLTTTEGPTPDDQLLGMTVQDILDDDTRSWFFKNWWGILKFYHWIKDVVTKRPPPSPAPTPTSQTWELLIQLDQGQTGHCVGFGTSNWLACAPTEDSGVTDQSAHDLYYWIKANIDGEPKAEDGSTVHAAAKAMKQLGHLNAYAWASSYDEIVAWVSSKGPVVMGTDWDNNMFNPDADGFVKTGGGVAGGHCFLCLGYDNANDALVFDNSWGSSWGLGGRFKMRRAEFNKLWGRFGNEAMAAVEV